MNSIEVTHAPRERCVFLNGLSVSFTFRYASHHVSLSHFGISTSPPDSSRHAPGIYQCLRYIIKNEGARGLFKGLGPNLIGVAPSRAIYFCAYSKSKVAFNAILPPDTPIVHVFSASCAGKTTLFQYYIKYMCRDILKSSFKI